MDTSKISVAIFDKYADKFQSEYFGSNLYNNSFDFFCDLIKTRNATILEVGCGPGNITKYVLD
ncbi:MAG: hypothetical protein QM485_08815 [Flavobacteriaceae bacterium]